MAWEENSRICINMQLIAILSRTGVDIVSIVVIIKHSKGLAQDEVLERLKIGCSVAVFLLGMLLVYYIVYLFW